MTNNPTIDGVLRELLSKLLAWLARANEKNEDGDIAEFVELRALLDAPAVERQEPIKTPAMPYKMLPLEEDGWFQCINAYEAMYPLYDGFAIARHSKRLIEQQESTIAQLQARIAELESGLGGMLFAFDDGVGRGWSEKLLDYARKLTPAVEFDATAALNKYSDKKECPHNAGNYAPCSAGAQKSAGDGGGHYVDPTSLNGERK